VPLPGAAQPPLCGSSLPQPRRLTADVSTSAAERSRPMPPDLEDVVLQLDAAEREAEALIRDLDDARLNWQPGPSAWSVGQCLDHLNAASRVQLVALRAGAAIARRRGWVRRGPIAPGAPSRWFLRSLEPPPRSRLRAPRKIVPGSKLSGREVGEEFARQQAQVRELLRAVADLDLNRARYVNPFVPLIRFTLGTGFLTIAAHQRRHLWQAARVRQSPSFP
jgi:hypothetical protein